MTLLHLLLCEVIILPDLILGVVMVLRTVVTIIIHPLLGSLATPVFLLLQVTGNNSPDPG